MSESKLPGLSRLTEEQLREQYQSELSAPAPAELSTRQSLIDAIQAHRDTAAPTTALDTLMPNGNTLNTDSTAGAGNPNDSAQERDTGPSANAAGPVVKPATEEAIPEGVVRAVNDSTGIQNDFPQATWDALGKAGQKGFTRQTAKPKDLQ